MHFAITRLIAIIVILMLAHKLMKYMGCGCGREQKQVEEIQNTRECSQKSINDSYVDYVFGSPAKFVR